jgi:hypothetical protein
MRVPVANPNLEDASETERIISPFAQTTSTVQPTRAGTSTSWPLWIVSGLLALVILGIIGYFIYKYVDDPYRTMDSFSMDKYLADYRSMEGGKFKADLSVSADLGVTPDTGRLMVFTLQEDNRKVVVLIPPKLSGIYFTKGQNYQMSLGVGEGGLIYANSCDKE